MSAVWAVLLLWVCTLTGALWSYRRDLAALWAEPVMRYPVLIFESDDWGAGPAEEQAAALNYLVDLLTQHMDHAGRHPVMTLALVLAVPDGLAISRDRQYHRQCLDAPVFAPVLAAIERGRAAGVFSVQLHGLEHYWPASLMASTDPNVRAWLETPAPAMTEQLPSHLQSRWVDASELPSSPLPVEQVNAAVAEEVALFQRVLGEKPRVAVPPTFVWNEAVENAWARQGIEFVVTPGLRSACRNAAGLPDCDTGPLHNAQGGRLTYVVRDDYFEPERGHLAKQALGALDRKWAQGRPCLLEIHRSNFIRGKQGCRESIAVVQDALSQSLARYPDVRFMATAELGEAMRRGDSARIEHRLSVRFAAWCTRLTLLPGFRRWAKLTGIYWLLFVPRWAIR
jgi:hypothetical protein